MLQNGQGLREEMNAVSELSWLDYDNDGFLDLYVGNYLNFDPEL